MGLSAFWLRVADRLGPDVFLEFWKLCDSEPALQSDRGDLEFRLRPFRSYLRYQRNRFIEELHRRGLTPQEIHQAVARELCEQIGLRHIFRIVTGK